MERVTQLYKKLENITHLSGVEFFGIADIRAIKKDFYFSDEILRDLDYAICIALRVSGSILNEIKDTPTKIYSHHYRQINIALDQIALRLSNVIQSEGYKALPIPASQIIDWEKQRGHMSHKKIGRLAGIGFIGRNNLLVNPALGSQFRLVSVLTDVPFEAGKELEIGCGDCRECIDVCPAGAIKQSVQDFDHIRCYEKLREFRNKNIVGQFICGVCVKICKGRR